MYNLLFLDITRPVYYIQNRLIYHILLLWQILTWRATFALKTIEGSK